MKKSRLLPCVEVTMVFQIIFLDGPSANDALDRRNDVP